MATKEERIDKILRLRVGRALRYARIHKEITQQTLTREAHVSAHWIGKIERGEVSPSLETVSAIAKVLDVKMSQIFQIVELDEILDFDESKVYSILAQKL